MKFILFSLVCFPHCIKMQRSDLRIIGGRNATENEFPYVVRLEVQRFGSIRSNQFICTCFVLTSTWTLTASHGITYAREQMDSIAGAQDKQVIVYQPSPKSEPAYSEVLSSIIHSSSSIDTIYNDIGLLHTQPVIIDKYAKLSPIDYTTLNGQQVAIVGYGRIGLDFPPQHQQVLEVIVRRCRENEYINYPRICFAPPCSSQKNVLKATCPGDSGGPCIHPSGIVAISVEGYPLECGLLEEKKFKGVRHDLGYKVGVGIPLSPFVDWISSIISKPEVV